MTTPMKKVPIGELLLQKVMERGIAEERICKLFRCSSEEVAAMYTCTSMDTAVLLKWCKLLEYDFFRHYSLHLTLSSEVHREGENNTFDTLPRFRKKMYSREFIDGILNQINKGEKTPQQVMAEYGVPKATIYGWKSKYQPSKSE